MLLDFSNTSQQSNGRCAKSAPPLQTQTMSTAYHSAGDDCAINELLEGRMELDVVLPDGRQVRLTVERRTPMMDLLVQAASATKISPGGHVIHVFGEGGKESGALQYKPSTPIGSLDTNTICIVPKKDLVEPPMKRMPKTANRPFEPTFRVQVHLPRNQLTVARVSPRVKISELRNMVCQEKGLDTSRYQLVRPSNLALRLDGDMTLAQYGSTELTLLSNSCIDSHICNSTSHIIPYSKRIEDKKRTGILRLLAEDTKRKGTKSTAGRPIPVPTSQTRSEDLPKPPTRSKPKKRRPAPPPPPREAASHSRQSSSDSSGYHEATSSFFHDDHHSGSATEKASSDSSGVSSLNATGTPPVCGKKRRAPPPPAARGSKEDLRDSMPEDSATETDGDVVTAPATIALSEKPISTPEAMDVATVSDEGEATVQHQEPMNSSKMVENEPVNIGENVKSSSDDQLIVQKENSNKDSDVKLPDDDGVDRPTVTRVVLATLSARIEQDVTQQEIASSIEAAFCSLDERPSLLAIKQRRVQVEASVSSSVVDSTGRNCTDGVPSHEAPASVPSIDEPIVRDIESNKPLSVTEDTANKLKHVKVSPKPSVTEKEVLVVEEATPSPRKAESSKTLKRSSSLLNLADCRTRSNQAKSIAHTKHLQRSLTQLDVDDKQQEFEAEQDRLQREYIKLQRQFILWQKQLLNNHAMLREERIVPQYARALRQSHSLPDGVPENPSHEDYDSADSQDTTTRSPLVSRSYSYETTNDKSYTLPRSTINIPSLEMGSVQVSGSNTLRSSKTKSYFKPPQVRASTKTRQRLPPEIRKEGERDVDICDDLRILTTILPSFESLKLITETKENHGGETESSSPRLKETVTPSKLCNGKIKALQNGEDNASIHVSKLKSAFTNKYFNITDSKTTKVSLTNGENAIVKSSNIELSKNLNEHFKQEAQLKAPASSETSSIPPPPPPMPMLGIPNGSVAKVPPKTNGPRNGVVKKEVVLAVDPREALMLEVRKFGGRNSLRKISLAPSS